MSNKETFMAFDPLDPVDNMILTDPNCDDMVAEVESYIDNCAKGNNSIITESADEDIDYADDVDYFSDDGDFVDMPSDIASEDAEDYGAAEMELLAGDFANNDAIDSIDDMEFIEGED
jgi:hypothetical protein